MSDDGTTVVGGSRKGCTYLVVRKVAGDGDVLDLAHVGRELVGDVPRHLDRTVHGNGGNLDARGVRVGVTIHVGLAKRLEDDVLLGRKCSVCTDGAHQLEHFVVVCNTQHTR